MRNLLQSILLAGLLPVLVGWMNPLHDATKRGLEQYQKGEYDAAIQSYLDAEWRAPEDPRLAFNRGAVNYKMEKYDEALTEFEKALSTDDPRFRAEVRYNMGNAKFKKEDYPAAIEDYIGALKLFPDHQDAKFNLELARKRLKEQMDKNKQQQQQQQQQDKQQQQQKNGQDQQQQQEQKQEQKQQQQAEQKQGDKEQQQQQQAGKEQNKQQAPAAAGQKAEEISPEEAERILRNLARDEMEHRRDLQKQRSTRVGNPEKDW